MNNGASFIGKMILAPSYSVFAPSMQDAITFKKVIAYRSFSVPWSTEYIQDCSKNTSSSPGILVPFPKGPKELNNK